MSGGIQFFIYEKVSLTVVLDDGACLSDCHARFPLTGYAFVILIQHATSYELRGEAVTSRFTQRMKTTVGTVYDWRQLDQLMLVLLLLIDNDNAMDMCSRYNCTCLGLNFGRRGTRGKESHSRRDTIGRHGVRFLERFQVRLCRSPGSIKSRIVNVLVPLVDMEIEVETGARVTQD